MNLTGIFIEALNFFVGVFGGSIAWAIIAVTILIRIILLPLILPSLRSMKKIQTLAPEIEKLKRKYGKEKEVFAKKQMELYQQHGVNPLAGCLPQLIQVGLFIVFYHVLVSSLKADTGLIGSSQFLWLNIKASDPTYIMPILTGLTQFILGIMLIPATSVTAEKKLAATTSSGKDDKESMDMDSMAKAMQTQMVFLMPIVTGIAALSFPSGLALYWVTSTVFSIIQQYFVSGPGGLKQYAIKFGIIKE